LSRHSELIFWLKAKEQQLRVADRNASPNSARHALYNSTSRFHRDTGHQNPTRRLMAKLAAFADQLTTLALLTKR